jgi:estrogen-related receptor beta like 1
MDKIDSREKHLNRDLRDLINQYKEMSVEMSKIQSEVRENEIKKSDLDEQITKITNELENVKIQMEQRGNSMTDGSPLINIKKAVMRLKEEISEYDIKIGVMQQTLTNDIIRRKNHYAEFDLGTTSAA